MPQKELFCQSVLYHVSFHLHSVLGGIHGESLAVGIDIIAVLTVFDEAEGVVFLDLLNGTAGGVVIIFKRGVRERAYAYKLVIDVVHFALGEGDGGAGDKQADAVLVRDDLEVGGIDDLHGVGEVGHEIGYVEAVLGNALGDTFHDVVRHDERLVAVDHNVKIRLNLVRNLPQTLGRGLAVLGGHDDLRAEAFRCRLDLFAVGGDVYLVEYAYFLGMLPDPVDHGLAADKGKGLVVESCGTAAGGDHADDFHNFETPFSRQF